MAIKELIEAAKLPAGRVAISIILKPVLATFLAHEGIGILANLVANPGMLLQISLQRRM